MLSFYIALYSLSEPSAYHWALIALPKGESLINGPVQMYQIVTAQEGSEPGVEDGYTSRHGLRDLLKDDSFERLLCAVELPDLDTTLPDLDAFMLAQPTGQRDTPLFETAWRRWGCSQWAIRVIKGLVDSGAVVPRSNRSFFTPAAASRSIWGPMIHVACTKCAHGAVAARNAGGGVSEDVPIVTLASSGINL